MASPLGKTAGWKRLEHASGRTKGDCPRQRAVGDEVREVRGFVKTARQF